MVRLEGNRTRNPQSSNADSRPIAQNALEKPPAITNELLNDFSWGVLPKLQQDIQKTQNYAINLDQTLDALGKEQMSLYFCITIDNLHVQEVFYGFYETTSTTSEELFIIVKGVLFRFQLPIDQCRRQCYDGAANVSGHVNGLHKKLIHEESGGAMA